MQIRTVLLSVFITCHAVSNDKCRALLHQYNQDGLPKKGAEMETRKNFSEIVSAYDFFVSHSNEKEVNANVIVREIRNWLTTNSKRLQEITLLDFGSGDGAFLEYVLKQLDGRVGRIIIVDPVEEYRILASKRLGKYSYAEVLSLKDLNESKDLKADIIISNHVLYYVPQISDALTNSTGRLNKNGILIATMATENNDLIRGWQTLFPAIGLRVPYNLNFDLRKHLNDSQLSYKSFNVQGKLKFLDTQINRDLITKFLMGNHQNQIDLAIKDSFFNNFSANGFVEMNIQDEVFVIKVL